MWKQVWMLYEVNVKYHGLMDKVCTFIYTWKYLKSKCPSTLLNSLSSFCMCRHV